MDTLAVAVMDQPHPFCRAAIMDRLFQGIEDKPGMGGCADPPAALRRRGPCQLMWVRLLRSNSTPDQGSRGNLETRAAGTKGPQDLKQNCIQCLGGSAEVHVKWCPREDSNPQQPD